MEETPEQYAERLLKIILKSKDLKLDSPLFPENQVAKAEEEKMDSWNELLAEFGLPPVPVKKAEPTKEPTWDDLLKEFDQPPMTTKAKPKEDSEWDELLVEFGMKKPKKSEQP